jgi:hypothetical protein
VYLSFEEKAARQPAAITTLQESNFKFSWNYNRLCSFTGIA